MTPSQDADNPGAHSSPMPGWPEPLRAAVALMGPHNHQGALQQPGRAVKPGPGQLVIADLNQDPGLRMDVMLIFIDLESL